MEVDLVVERPEGLLTIEIKSGVGVAPQAADSLVRFAGLAQVPPERRLLVYGGTQTYRQAQFCQVAWRDLESYTGYWFESGELPPGMLS